jgi:hypothetical protein
MRRVALLTRTQAIIAITPAQVGSVHEIDQEIIPLTVSSERELRPTNPTEQAIGTIEVPGITIDDDTVKVDDMIP